MYPDKIEDKNFTDSSHHEIYFPVCMICLPKLLITESYESNTANSYCLEISEHCDGELSCHS